MLLRNGNALQITCVTLVAPSYPHTPFEMQLTPAIHRPGGVRSRASTSRNSLSSDRLLIICSYNPHSGTTALRHPPIYTRTATRRPSHGSSSSVSSNRRPSLPTIHLQPSPPSGTPLNESSAYPNNGAGGTDDLYSNLSSFTFGSAHTVRSDHLDMSPIPPPSGTSSADRTPRPSISGPSSGSSHASSSTRSRTPRIRSRELDDEGCRADDEDEEMEQQGRAKMRAMNDGTRRPSLPMNLRRPDSSHSPQRRTSVSHSVQRSGTSSSERARDSTPETSEAETEPGMRDEDGEHDAEAGDFDTDVEMDYRHAITPASRVGDMSDTASQHTFGGDYREYVYNSNSVGHSDDRMSVSETSEPDDEVPELPMVTQTEYSIDIQGNVAVVQGRRSSIPWATPEVPETVPRDREDSLATLTGSPTKATRKDHQASSPTDPLGVQSFAQDQPLQPAEPDPFSGFNLNYILGTRADDNGDNKSWHSAGSAWMQVDPHYAPPVPMDGARPSADFEAFDFQGWGAPVTGVSGRRPSTVTVSSLGEDAFMRHLQRYDPVSSTRAVEWTFKRESADGTSQDIIPGTRWVQGAARAIAPGTQEIWRQAHVGRFKVDKLLMRGSCAFAVTRRSIHDSDMSCVRSYYSCRRSVKAAIAARQRQTHCRPVLSGQHAGRPYGRSAQTFACCRVFYLPQVRPVQSSTFEDARWQYIHAHKLEYLVGD